MKQKPNNFGYIIVLVFILLTFASCSDQDFSHDEKFLGVYQAFLENEIPAVDANGELVYCNDIAKTDGTVQYTFVDMTHDDMPELHVIGRIEYLILTVKEDKLVVWYKGTAYERLLNNHAVLYTRAGTGTSYKYITFSENGVVNAVVFSVETRADTMMQYYFEGEELTQAEFEKKTEPFLSQDSNEIVWSTKEVVR